MVLGFLKLAAVTPLATTTIGALGNLGTGIGNATQTLVSAGFAGSAAKLSGANMFFKEK